MIPWKRTRIFIAMLALGLGGVYAFSRPSTLPGPRADGDTGLRIVAANLFFRNPQPREAAARITGLEPDVILLLEWSGLNLKSKALRRAGLEPVLNEYRRGAHGAAVWLDAPLEGSASLVDNPVPGPCAMPLAVARIKHGRGHLTLLGVHAPPPIRVCEGLTQPTLMSLAGMIEAGRLIRDLGPGRSGDPVIVAGDLNAFPFSEGLARLRDSGLLDSYAEHNLMPSGTWSPGPWFPPLARIDYILVPKVCKVLDARVLDLPGSDHRLVSADLDCTL